MDQIGKLFPTLNEAQVNELIKVRMRNGQPLNFNSLDLLAYCDLLLRTRSFEVLIEYAKDSENLEDFIFNGITPKMVEARTQNARQLSLQTTKVEPVVLNERCSNCGNNKFYHTIVQRASGDEALTNIYRCANCGQVRTKR